MLIKDFTPVLKMVSDFQIKTCRSCGHEGNFIEVMNLGEQYISDFVDSENDQGTKVPLELILCPNCNLLQLRHNAPNESMWGGKYWYKSGINRMIREDLNDIANCSEKLVDLKQGDIVVDIGCNDGTLLSFYDKSDLRLVGFEPSKNVAKEAEQKGIEVIDNYFNSEDFRRRFGEKKAKVITAISMFYDLEDPNKFMQDIVKCLDANGLFVIQQNYLVSMLERNAFDNVCHEHREYYSLSSLNHLLEKYNLEVFDVKLNDINGGSIRTHIRFKGNNLMNSFKGSKERVAQTLEKENKMQLHTQKPYLEFAARVDEAKNYLIKFVKNETAKGKTFGLCGASTRGNTILQYFNLTHESIKCAAEANSDKFGKKTVGTLIPIVSVDEMKRINPDYQIVMIWHLFESLMNQEKDYLKNGGKFILPLSEFAIIEYSKEFDRLMVKKFL